MVATLLLTLTAFGPYQKINVEGFTLQVERKATESSLWPIAKKEIDNQLYRIARVVPDGPLSSMRKLTIWVHLDDKATACAAYHPAPEWLKEHGSDPAMAKGLEIANLEHFISWTYEQPWMLLHELSHGYHDQFLSDGFENKDVKETWQRAMSSKRYDSVLHWNGSQAKHYGENNQMEFFAESTEAYFGQNDFYPFVNAELKTFDPETYALMVRIWGVPQKRLGKD